ncbi:hypothetical protein Tco_0680103 [Tanacetum coccineum]|uniref:Reverse transcriptase Ty1/copia-type domain-containing protein n=1 Tax=Tanacetum coccineum TaxID=301880 RepID=A0ABQ4XJM1_9ASTR
MLQSPPVRRALSSRLKLRHLRKVRVRRKDSDISSGIMLMKSVLSWLLDWGLVTGNGDSPLYPLHLGGLAFIQQTKLLHIDIVAFGFTFDVTLCVFNNAMEIDFLNGLMAISKGRAYLGLALCGSDLWLGQTMNACSRVFVGDIYGDHVVSCAGIVGIKHRHNVVRDTLVDICFRSGISAGKKVDIGLDGGCDKKLCPADMLLYSWDGGLDVCVDLTGSSPLTHTVMTDFALGRVMIDVAHRKRGKYMAKCAAIGYGFLPFSFSSLGELEAYAVTLLKRIQKFSMAQDIGARAPIHIFNRITFAIAKGDSPIDLIAYSDSDYAGASIDTKSTTRGCQLLGSRLVFWQCKKQTIVANSTTEAEDIDASHCCGQVLWLQNQLLDYGYNFMRTKIHIDNDSTISVIKNPISHSKTKHIEIQFHFIRDSYEKKLIEMVKIHMDNNVADLLTKAFDVTRCEFLIASIEAFFEGRNSMMDVLKETAVLSTTEEGLQAISATIDGHEKLITEASLRRH